MKLITALAAGLLLLACEQPNQPAGPDNSLGPDLALAAGPAALTAEVEFGSDAVGSAFPPAEHDNSFHAFDKLRPRTVVIQRGGSVTYEVDECHQPAVYAPGTKPEDINASLTESIGLEECPPDRINDPHNRLALAPAQSEAEADWTTPPGTFDQPGVYLVICTTRVHFVFAKMYGWVIVK
jgi:plastocyanin